MVDAILTHVNQHTANIVPVQPQHAYVVTQQHTQQTIIAKAAILLSLNQNALLATIITMAVVSMELSVYPIHLLHQIIINIMEKVDDRWTLYILYHCNVMCGNSIVLVATHKLPHQQVSYSNCFPPPYTHTSCQHLT